MQVPNEKAYRSLSYFSEWEPIGRHYPELAMAGLPQHSPEVLSHEVKRRVMRLGNKPALNDDEIEMGPTCNLGQLKRSK